MLVNSTWSNVPEVLNVHMNEICRKITTIKWNKLKFKKVLKTRQTDRQTERHTDRRKDRQIDGTTDRRNARQTDGTTDRQTYGKTDR